MDFITKDSGQREEFSTGAVRDSGDKPCYELISPFALERLAIHLTNGAKTYDRRNWEKGMPFERTWASAKRHMIAYEMGKTDEDHLAALFCNIHFLLHYEELIKRGLLSKALDDMPKWLQNKKDRMKKDILPQKSMTRKDAFICTDKIMDVANEVMPECFREKNPVIMKPESVTLIEKYLEQNDWNVEKTIDVMREKFWAKDIYGKTVSKDYVEHFGENVI